MDTGTKGDRMSGQEVSERLHRILAQFPWFQEMQCVQFRVKETNGWLELTEAKAWRRVDF